MRESFAELQQRCEVVPQAMKALPQWLVWRFVQKGKQSKPSKMPYYLNGELRGWPRGRPEDGKPTEDQPQVDQGHPLDREHLATFEQALAAMRTGRWAGLGFAFLPGDGLIGIDVDNAIDADGVMSDHCREIVARCNSYTELSPSGKGLHVIVAGECTTFKSNAVGVEVFCGRQFFTVTARPAGGSHQVNAIAPETLEWLQVLVKGAAAVPPTQAAAPTTKPDDFSRINTMALALLDMWVPQVFPTARRSDKGYRVPQADLGRPGLEEDLSITGKGIVDYGVHDMGDPRQGKRTPIDLVMEWKGLRNHEALRWLADQLGVRLDPLKKSTGLRPPAPPDEFVQTSEQGVAAEEPSWVSESSPPPSDVEGPAEPTREGGGGRQRRAKKRQGNADLSPDQLAAVQAFWARVDAMSARFRFIEATDTAWDNLNFQIWRVPNMRLRFGQEVVKAWLGRVAADVAPTVKPADLVFEPGQQVPEHQINMFDGLEVEPSPSDPTEVEPMLALLRHLCAESSECPDERDNIMHWVLCWMALPLQQLGTKMQTALVFHGAQGTGKNLFWDMWRDLYGVYGVTVGQTEIEDKFNGWISRKLAIIGDEVVSRQEMYHNKNRLKSVVTQEKKFAIRGMQQETRWESNHANVVFLSNESQPLALEERDRRYMVIYTPLEADAELYQRVRVFKATGGLEKWLHYLMNYPLGEFTAHTKPIMTRAKRELIELNWKAPERFVNDWLDGYLDLPVRVCESAQLYRAFRRWCDREGEKWPPARGAFTHAVNRYAKERLERDPVTGKFPPPRLTYKVVSWDAKDGGRRSARCFIPQNCGPRNGISEGEWAADSIESFEESMAKFMGRQHEKEPA